MASDILANIGSSDGLSPGGHQTITWSTDWTSRNKIWTEVQSGAAIVWSNVA